MNANRLNSRILVILRAICTRPLPDLSEVRTFAPLVRIPGMPDSACQLAQHVERQSGGFSVGA